MILYHNIISLYKMKLFAYLPEDIIINHILPYTYQEQPKKILKDIIFFYSTLKKVEDYYLFEYNYTILLNDIISFCLWLKNPVFVFIKKNRLNEKGMIRLYWAKLKPYERLLFIRRYCRL